MHRHKQRKLLTSRILTSALQLNVIFLVRKINSVINVLIFRWMGIKLLSDGHIMAWTRLNKSRGVRLTIQSSYLSSSWRLKVTTKLTTQLSLKYLRLFFFKMTNIW